MIVDAFGSSEALGMGSVGDEGPRAQTAKFTRSARHQGDHRGRPRGAAGLGRDRHGAVGGWQPVGYYKDEAKSAATFIMFEGERYSFPGDYAMVEADGSLTLLGRGSLHQHRRREGLPRGGRGGAANPPAAVPRCALVGGGPGGSSRLSSLAAGSKTSPEDLIAHTKSSWPTTRRPRRSCSWTTCLGRRTARPTTRRPTGGPRRGGGYVVANALPEEVDHLLDPLLLQVLRQHRVALAVRTPRR